MIIALNIVMAGLVLVGLVTLLAKQIDFSEQGSVKVAPKAEPSVTYSAPARSHAGAPRPVPTH